MNVPVSYSCTNNLKSHEARGSSCHADLTSPRVLSPRQTCPVCRLSMGPPLQAQRTLASPSVTRVTATVLTLWPLTTPSWTWVEARSQPLPPLHCPASMSLWRGVMSPNLPAFTRCPHTGPSSKRRRRAIQLLHHWKSCPPLPCTLNNPLLPPPPPHLCLHSPAHLSFGRRHPWSLSHTLTP